MIYLLIKALHVASVLTFVGGLIALVVTSNTHNLVVARSIVRWDKMVTSPALGLVWITGLIIAGQGQWFAQVWLMLKVVIVMGLSATHGMLAGSMRRTERGAEPHAGAIARITGPGLLVAITTIAFLVVVKPKF